MDPVNYEKLLQWLATVSIFVRNPVNKPVSNTKCNLAIEGLGQVSYALGSQSQLWREASARLSGDPIDFGTFELRRAIDTLRLPDMCKELQEVVTDCFGSCPQLEDFV